MLSLNSWATLLAAMLAATSGARAQYDEECHYECVTVYCDLFEDYCDYDCHEICYPYRKSSELPVGLATKTSTSGHYGVKGGFNPVADQRPASRISSRESDFKTRPAAKVFRMRIKNSNISPQQSGSGRISPAPNRFALFQSCLSGN